MSLHASYHFTILTEPPTLSYKLRKFLFKIKQYVKLLLSYFTKNGNWRAIRTIKYGGHYAVTRSIVEGLEKIKVPFNYNPKNPKHFFKTVFVPANIDALDYAIKLKKQGLIEKIIAGPNISVLPNEITSLANYRLIDIYVQPSQWVINWWEKISGKLFLNLKVWYAGVNTDFWVPSLNKKSTKKVLLYKKHVSEIFFLNIKSILENNGFLVEVLNYGCYSQQEYLESLHNNSFLVHLTESESQGLSLAEAWSANIPTLVWDPAHTTYEGIEITNSSSSPYLTKETGISFKDSDDFKKILRSLSQRKFSPRKWVLENMSDQICAQNLISLITEEC